MKWLVQIVALRIVMKTLWLIGFARSDGLAVHYKINPVRIVVNRLQSQVWNDGWDFGASFA